MELIRLNPNNSHLYIGKNILFKCRGQFVVSKILRVSRTGKSLKMDHNDLNGYLEIVSRKVHVIID